MSTANKAAAISVFCEFLEIAIHNIVYARNLYPETIFKPKRKYGVVVYQSIHPDVNSYIENCVKTIEFHLKENQLRGVFVCFLCGGKVVEKYHFEVVSFGGAFESDPFLLKIEQHLRDFLLRVSSSFSYLKPLPDDSTFSVELQVTEYSCLNFNLDPRNEDFPWVGTQATNQSTEIVPVQTIRTDFLNLQIYVE